MANAEQLLSLIRSHLDNDDAQFRRVALQIAAAEGKSGHGVMARTIQELLNQKTSSFSTLRFTPRSKEIDDLLLPSDTPNNLNSLVVSTALREKLNRVVREYMKRDELRKFGLANRRKLLLYGPPGTGKTFTAGALAKTVNLPFFIVRTEKVVTKFMGETGQKLARIFDFISDIPGVYLFDEFDAIGSQRGMDNEVGEQRKILNTFLQLLDRDLSDSFIVAATNNVEAIDQAMFRRFDDVVEYNMPDRQQRMALLHEYLYTANHLDFSMAEPLFEGMSHAEIKMVCADIFKESLLNDNAEINLQLVRSVIDLRRKQHYRTG